MRRETPLATGRRRPQRRRGQTMAERSEHDPGALAPVGGEYELLSVFGSPTGVRVSVMHGHPFPAAAHGHKWGLVAEDAAKRLGCHLFSPSWGIDVLMAH